MSSSLGCRAERSSWTAVIHYQLPRDQNNPFICVPAIKGTLTTSRSEYRDINAKCVTTVTKRAPPLLSKNHIICPLHCWGNSHRNGGPTLRANWALKAPKDGCSDHQEDTLKIPAFPLEMHRFFSPNFFFFPGQESSFSDTNHHITKKLI